MLEVGFQVGAEIVRTPFAVVHTVEDRGTGKCALNCLVEGEADTVADLWWSGALGVVLEVGTECFEVGAAVGTGKCD